MYSYQDGFLTRVNSQAVAENTLNIFKKAPLLAVTCTHKINTPMQPFDLVFSYSFLDCLKIYLVQLLRLVIGHICGLVRPNSA